MFYTAKVGGFVNPRNVQFKELETPHSIARMNKN